MKKNLKKKIVKFKIMMYNLKSKIKIKDYNGLSYIVQKDCDKKKLIIITGSGSCNQIVTIPDTINNIPVVAVRKKAFKNNKYLKKIVLSNNIRYIGHSVFKNCPNLKEVELSCEIKVISKYCFYNCPNLEKVFLPFELIKIEKYAFANCSQLYDLSHYLKTRYGDKKLFNPNIIDKHLPIALKYIDNYAFLNCHSLKEVYLPFGLEILNKGIFKNCQSLTYVPLHNNIKIIKNKVFWGCDNLKQIKLPNISGIRNNSFTKSTKLLFYNDTEIKIKKALNKYKHEIITSNNLNLNSQMIPNNKKSFYTSKDIEKALKVYEMRPIFKEKINRKEEEIKVSKSKYFLENNNYIYNSNKKNSATIIMTGDVMCRSYQINKALKNGEYDFDESFENIKKIIKKGDLSICNLETPIAPSLPYSTEKRYIDDQIHMNAPVEFLQSVKNSGFDMVITSNNHMYDAGFLGLFETIDKINKCNLIHTGTFAGPLEKRHVNVVINDINIGIISYCSKNFQKNKMSNFSNIGVQTLFSYFDENQIKKDIKNAKKDGAEFIIAYCHWGKEYTDKLVINQKKYANFLAEQGVDYIFGTHPHCLQNYTIITTSDNRQVPCLYSSGNFISDMAVKLPEVRDTLILQLELSRNQEGKIVISNEGYYPCLIETNKNIRGGTKTHLIQDLINNTNNKNKLYNDLTRIKNTVKDNSEFKMIIDAETEKHISYVPSISIPIDKRKQKKKSFKTRLVRKIKNIAKKTIYTNRKKLTLKKICQICEIEIPYKYKKYKNKRIEQISVINKFSTKFLKPNSIVFTNLTKNFSASFLENLKKNSLFIISKQNIPECKCIIVKNPMDKAIKILNYLKSINKITTITITGSVGKTTTKDMVNKVLVEKYHSKLLASKGNSNYIPTIANNILNIKNKTKVYLQEVGMPKNKGKMKIMAKILEPDIIIYTNIRDAHIEGYGSRENILKEKAELANCGNHNGLVFINYDDELLRKYKFKQKTLSFSLENPKADYYAKDIKFYNTNNTSVFTIVNNVDNKTLQVRINTLGNHNVMNAIVAYAVGKTLSIDDFLILKGLEKYKPTSNRQNLIKYGKYQIFADCYNSSYDGIKSMIDIAKLINLNAQGKKIAVIGDIFELGNHSEDIHRKVGKLLTNSIFDKVIFYGDLVKYSYEECKEEKNNSVYVSTYQEAIKNIKKIIKPDDLIVFKASHGMHYSDLIDTLFGTDMGESSAISDKRYQKEEKDGFTFNVYEQKVTAVNCLKDKSKILIPDKINDKPIEKLGSNLFKDNKTIKEITLPKYLVRIDNSCFENSTLENIKFNNDLKVIAENSFVNTNIKELHLPESILIIDTNAFANCKNLTKVYIPKEIESINDSAFSQSSNVTIICEKDSYAMKYAIKNKIAYKIEKLKEEQTEK